MRRSIVLLGSLGLGLLSEGAAAAESTSADSTVLEEVTVTARKRAENAQDVPIAITAIGQQKLQELGAESMASLVERVPNFDWDPVGMKSLSSWGLRGIVDQSRNAGQESGLGMYVDGVFVGRPVGFDVSLADIDHVEVLRGPQGTLYGRNTIAGAVNITTRRPTEELGLDADLNFGNYSRTDAAVGISGPLVPRVLTGKFSAFEQRNDGYVHNVADNRDLLNENRQGGRGALYWSPAEALEVNLAADMMHEDHRTAFGLSAEPQLNAAIPNWFFGSPFVTNQNDPNFEKIDTVGGSLTVNWMLPNGLLLTSITAERFNNFDLDNDDDAGPITLTHSHFVDKSQMFSQELRITSKQNSLYDYVAGLYYLDENVRTNRHTSVASWPAENLGILDYGKVVTRSYAAFGNLNYHFATSWTAGVGLRFTDDKKDGNFVQTVNVPLGFQSAFVSFPSVSRDDKQVSGDVTLTWSPVTDLLGYATVRRGFKSGGFQTDIIDFSDVAQFSFKPETATTYELGLKTETPSHRVRLNGAVFDTEYRNMQVSQLAGLGFTTANAGKSRIRGLEVEADFLPIEHLTIGLSAGWLNAKYLSFPSCDSLGLNIDCSGNRLQFTPEWNLGSTVDYRIPLTTGSILLHADTSSRGDEFGDALNQDGIKLLPNGEKSWNLKIGGYTLVGARIGYESPSRTWGVYAWGKNLTDHVYDLRRWRYPIIPLAFGFTGAQGIEFVPGQPRTYGIELTYRH